jgi:type II secretory pathway pseudopilin PulG
MLGRLIKDESGIAMGLAVIVVLLVGVMGAGLLVFVRNDLEAVVEVNQGQNAFDMADAGAQAAKRHLSKVDAEPENYDMDDTNGDSEWSEIDETGSGEKALDFDRDGNDDISVSIRYLEPSDVPTDTEDEDSAPEEDIPEGTNYFRVTARGEEGEAARQVRAIYRTENIGFPVAYYATRDIDFNGNATSVEGISLFAGRCVIDLRGDNITGEDDAYGNWANDYNAEPRLTTEAGVAAPGGTCGSGIDYKSGSAGNYGSRDFDSVSPNKTFQKNTWGDLADQPDDVITYPFETDNVAADAEAIDRLRERAQEQGNYVSKASGTDLTIEGGSGTEEYPLDSDLETVYFVEFADGAKGDVDYKVKDTSNADDLVKGTIVVINGDLETSSAAKDFRGSFVVRDPNDADNDDEDNVMEYDNGGSLNVEGFVNVEGDIKLSGNVDGVLPTGLEDGIPGLYEVNLWSWRECYSEDCN